MENNNKLKGDTNNCGGRRRPRKTNPAGPTPYNNYFRDYQPVMTINNTVPMQENSNDFPDVAMHEISEATQIPATLSPGLAQETGNEEQHEDNEEQHVEEERSDISAFSAVTVTHGDISGNQQVFEHIDENFFNSEHPEEVCTEVSSNEVDNDNEELKDENHYSFGYLWVQTIRKSGIVHEDPEGIDYSDVNVYQQSVKIDGNGTGMTYCFFGESSGSVGTTLIGATGEEDSVSAIDEGDYEMEGEEEDEPPKQAVDSDLTFPENCFTIPPTAPTIEIDYVPVDPFEEDQSESSSSRSTEGENGEKNSSQENNEIDEKEKKRIDNYYQSLAQNVVFSDEEMDDEEEEKEPKNENGEISSGKETSVDEEEEEEEEEGDSEEESSEVIQTITLDDSDCE